MRFLVVTVALVLAAGCGGDDETASAPTTTEAATTGCTAATTDLMTPLANKLTLEGGRLTNGQIVQSAAHDDVYFVAAEIDSPRLAASGDIGIWATTSPHGAEAIFSVNDLAQQYSGWRSSKAIRVFPDDAAAEAARACVFR